MTHEPAGELPEVITFYSYKGGTGRTMALANIAYLLADRGVGDVLVIDWDLEAPGLDRFFAPHVARATERDGFDDVPGLLELFDELCQRLKEAAGEIGEDPDDSVRSALMGSIDIDRFLIRLDRPSLYFMKAGRYDDSYSSRVRAFPWEELHLSYPWLMTHFAYLLTERFRYVLIDSRTGLSETAGICTTLMPNKLVAMFIPNEQSLTGVIDRVRLSAAYRREDDDVRPLAVFPLPSRLDLNEDTLRRKWRFEERSGEFTGYQALFERLFEDIYDLPGCDLREYFDAVLLQHNSGYAYGEEIAVLDDTATDRLTLANSYREFCDRLVLPAPWSSPGVDVLPPSVPEPRPRSELRRVFLSYTSELREFPTARSFVAAAESSLARARLHTVDMGYVSSGTHRTAEYVQQALDDADVYVGIVGFKYGPIVPGRRTRSYMELELEYATRRGMPCLVFLLDDDSVVPLPARHLHDPEYGQQQEEFRSRLRNRPVVLVRVTNPADLEQKLYRELTELSQRPVSLDADQTPAAAPFMAPALPGRYVERRDPMTELIEMLDPSEPRTIGLWGKAGIGKRTLAIAACHEARPRFPGGVLWVTLGDEFIGDAALVERVNDLAEIISGRRPPFQGLEAASANLGRLLGEESRLLVVDDVRTESQLAPLLAGECVRLVTTRDRSLLPDDAIHLRVGPMTEAESMELLRYGLRFGDPDDLRELNRMTNGSPNLAGTANRAVLDCLNLGASVSLAASYVEACLATDGPRALGSAVGAASLRLLETGRPELLECYLRLAVFPEGIDVPLVTLSHCWGVSETEADRLSRELASSSLVEDRGDAGIRLHDVLRGGPARLAEYHRSFLDAYRVELPGAENGLVTAWWDMSPDEPYLWHDLAHHLREAGRDGGPEGAELDALQRDERWAAAQVRVTAPGTGRILGGHTSRVRAVAISPDGTWLVSGDADGALRLWTFATGAPRSGLYGHSGLVSSVAISPDGAWLASASTDGTICLWNADGSLRRLLVGHSDAVNGIAIASDGGWIAGAGADRTVLLWDAWDGSLQAVLAGHSGPARAVAISPDGTWLASTGDDWIGLWDVVSLRILATIGRRSNALTTVAISPDGSWLASGGRRGVVRLWNAVDGSPRRSCAGHTGPITAVAISPDGAWLASASEDGTIRLWDADDGSPRATLTGHTGPVNAVAISRDGAWLASAGDDKTVRLWRAP